MLLNIYLGTTAISWVITLIFSAACRNKLKREGYKFVKKKKSFPEKTVTFISSAVKGSMPIYNILNTILMLYMGDKIYNYMEDKLLEHGEIYKSDEEKLNNNCESPVLNKVKDDTCTANIQKTRTEKTYNEMTTEEKLTYLQQEKEKLINQITSQAENPFTLSKRRK